MEAIFNPLILGQRVKRLREKAGMSILKLAKVSGVNKNKIIAIEASSDRKIDLDTIFKLASPLKIEPSELIDMNPMEDVDYKIDKCVYKKKGKSERQEVFRNENYKIESIDIHLDGGKLLAGIMIFNPNGKEKGLSSHEGEELFFCLKGKINLNINGTIKTLGSGDAMAFWGGQPHGYMYEKSVGEKGELKEAVGLSIISDSGYDSLKALHDSLKIFDNDVS